MPEVALNRPSIPLCCCFSHLRWRAFLRFAYFLYILEVGTIVAQSAGQQIKGSLP